MARRSAIEPASTTTPPSIYASPNFNAGSRRTPLWAARVVKRMAAEDVPVLSPKVKVDPPAVVTRRFPARINLANISRTNQSIGRLLPRRSPKGESRSPRSGHPEVSDADQPCEHQPNQPIH